MPDNVANWSAERVWINFVISSCVPVPTNFINSFGIFAATNAWIAKYLYKTKIPYEIPPYKIVANPTGKMYSPTPGKKLFKISNWALFLSSGVSKTLFLFATVDFMQLYQPAKNVIKQSTTILAEKINPISIPLLAESGIATSIEINAQMNNGCITIKLSFNKIADFLKILSIVTLL